MQHAPPGKIASQASMDGGDLGDRSAAAAQVAARAHERDPVCVTIRVRAMVAAHVKGRASTVPHVTMGHAAARAKVRAVCVRWNLTTHRLVASATAWNLAATSAVVGQSASQVMGSAFQVARLTAPDSVSTTLAHANTESDQRHAKTSRRAINVLYIGIRYQYVGV